ncbi:hypothetical protein BJF78_20045 [Pseudonocardia sp. CNS-139]|nr:hypothetical protein BJF78_20045 [Pseudonocardia sp. CNS-139]
MHLTGVSLRTRILAAVLVPSVALLTVGIALSTQVVADALGQRARADAIAAAGQRALAFFPLLMEERATSLRYSADPSRLNRAAVTEWRNEVDAQLQAISDAAREATERLPAAAVRAPRRSARRPPTCPASASRSTRARSTGSASTATTTA